MYFSYVWNSTQPDQRNVGEFLWNIFVIPKDSTYGAHLVRVGGGAVLLPIPSLPTPKQAYQGHCYLIHTWEEEEW